MNDRTFRYRLILGKFQVKAVEHGIEGFRAAINFGQGVTLWMDCPIRADVQIGDMLTFYTEVLSHDQAGTH